LLLVLPAYLFSLDMEVVLPPPPPLLLLLPSLVLPQLAVWSSHVASQLPQQQQQQLLHLALEDSLAF
jgi:hypothetical protein